jgi:hypothetical protein
MKKNKLLIFVMAMMVIMVSSLGLAQINGGADTSKEGSLLIWPTVKTDSGNETYIVMNNNSPGDVYVKCYWEVKSLSLNSIYHELTNQLYGTLFYSWLNSFDIPAAATDNQCVVSDFTFQLGAHSPLIFRASNGSSLDQQGVAAGMGYSNKGALKCWAVDETGRKQISWNHLSGFAIIVRGDNTLPANATPTTSAWQYSAWRFAANVINSSGAFADGFWVGPVADVSGGANTMNLKASPTTVVNPVNCPSPYTASGCSLLNAAYDSCPKYMEFNFLAEPSGANETDGYAFNNLALVPCKTDLTGVTLNTKTKVNYTIWNENNVEYSGLYQCGNCAYTSDLGNLYVLPNQKPFQMDNLQTPSGHFRVEGKADSVCASDAVSTPLLGVMSSKIVGSNDIVAMSGSTGGKETSDYGYITWLPVINYHQMMRRQR